ncbi:ABC transporter permease [Thermobispora bispora]|uniref:ABC transporter permease n=1 Tax=Thermobispora bispora TaxID=2006 RepID=UPI00197F4847|nr:ABC transporter permease [Thermobispora bispora]QSI47277.1 ABC transporter permease [Thermobispora bispora]
MSEPAAVIHDLGYRRYEGARLSTTASLVVLGVHSLRGAFGLGRTARAKIVPWSLFGIMVLPAAAIMAFTIQFQERMVPFSQYTVVLQTVAAIFLAAQAPYLVAPDLRYRILPLYLSRPLTVPGYVAAKVAALTAAMFLLFAAPITLLFLGEALADLPGRPQVGEYLGALAGALVFAVVLASIGLALASVTPRRGLGVATVIGFYLFTAGASGVASGLLREIGERTAAEWVSMANPFFLVDAVQVTLFGADPVGSGYPAGPLAALITIAVVAVAWAALVLRYRKVVSS